MTVQSKIDHCKNLFHQGKYKSCLAELQKSNTADVPARERVEALLLAARIQRQLTNFGLAADHLEIAKSLADQVNDQYLELEVELVLNAVHAKLVRNKDAAKQLVHESELLLNKVRQLEHGARYDRLLLTALCELGLTKISSQDIELAAQNLRVAAGLAEETYGVNSAEMIFPAVCLARVHALEDKHSLSLVMARNAAQTARANFGKNHPLLIQPLYCLAQAATRQKLFDLALETCRQVENLIIEHIGEESDIYVDLLGIKTAALTVKVEIDDAEIAASKRLKLMEKMRGKDDPKLIDPLCDLAQVLAQKGDRERAEKYFDRALKLVAEATRDKGFSEDIKSGEEPLANTAGSRLGNSSLCHLEYDLIERLSECYLWQGKIADVAKMMPASFRSAHTCKVDAVVSLIDNITKHFEERARKLDSPS